MATPLYDALVREVIDWSNRDPEVFGATTTSDPVVPGTVQRFLQYAADKCYRHLRVPSLEITREFVVEATDIQETDAANDRVTTVNMGVPEDLIEVIFIRDRTTGTVFEEKLDNRTFFQRNADKTSQCYWTRVGDNFKVSGFISPESEEDAGDGSVLEIHYYRRLPALNTTYVVSAATYKATSAENRVLTLDTTVDPIVPTEVGESMDNVLWFEPDDPDMENPFDTAQTLDSRGYTYSGNEIYHWLRDENERILLFGALAEASIYLMDGEDLQRYAVIFQQEIEELNREETMRQSRGGNVKVNFNGGGFI